MLSAFKEVYERSWLFILACPLLAFIPFIAEFAQHVVEVNIGMYDSWDKAEATENHPLRTAFAVIKLLCLYLPYYWVARYMVSNNSTAEAFRWENKAIRLFLRVLVWNMATALLVLFGPDLFVSWGMPSERGSNFFTFMFFAITVIGIYLTNWSIAAPLGNERIGFFRSFKIMHGNFWWSIGFTFFTVLPLMIVHYAIGNSAIGQSATLVWIMMLFDSAVVSYLVVIQVTTAYVNARRATSAKSIDLLPNRPT